MCKEPSKARNQFKPVLTRWRTSSECNFLSSLSLAQSGAKCSGMPKRDFPFFDKKQTLDSFIENSAKGQLKVKLTERMARWNVTQTYLLLIKLPTLAGDRLEYSLTFVTFWYEDINPKSLRDVNQLVFPLLGTRGYKCAYTYLLIYCREHLQLRLVPLYSRSPVLLVWNLPNKKICCYLHAVKHLNLYQ